MNGVTHRLLDRGDLRAEALGRPGVVGRQGDVLGERTVHVHAQDPKVRADVLPPGPALVAALVDQMGLGCDQGPQRNLAPTTQVRAVSNHPAGHLVAEDSGQAATQPALCPVVPAVDVEVGAAQAGGLDPDQQLAVAGHRDRHVAQLGPGRRIGLDQGSHRARDLAIGHACLLEPESSRRQRSGSRPSRSPRSPPELDRPVRGRQAASGRRRPRTACRSRSRRRAPG